MAEYLSPGVYIEERSSLGRTVVPVPTAVPAFVGYTEKAQLNQPDDLKLVPTRVTSMLEYQQWFGGANVAITVSLDKDGQFTQADVAVAAQPNTLLYQLQLYFANGGAVAWIISLGNYSAPPTLGDQQKAFDALNRSAGITLLYFSDLSNLSTEDRMSLYSQALSWCGGRGDCFLVMDQVEPLAGFRLGIGTNYLSYGAAYTPILATTLPWQQADSQVKLQKKSGVNATNVNFLSGKTLAQAKESGDERAKAIVTAKWLGDLYAAIASLPAPTLPPGGAVLGAICSTDERSGVWKAPANVQLAAIAAPTIKYLDAAQIELNTPSDGQGKSINAIRKFEGKGTLIWGARTLDGISNDWRYIQVRRTVIYIEQSLKNALQQLVFEPNNANTWTLVRSLTEGFLSNLWQSGGLAGATAKDAFGVSCGLGSTMTQDDILNGILRVNILVAVTRPAEFIVITLSQSMIS